MPPTSPRSWTWRGASRSKGRSRSGGSNGSSSIPRANVCVRQGARACADQGTASAGPDPPQQAPYRDLRCSASPRIRFCAFSSVSTLLGFRANAISSSGSRVASSAASFFFILILQLAKSLADSKNHFNHTHMECCDLRPGLLLKAGQDWSECRVFRLRTEMIE